MQAWIILCVCVCMCKGCPSSVYRWEKSLGVVLIMKAVVHHMIQLLYCATTPESHQVDIHKHQQHCYYQTTHSSVESYFMLLALKQISKCDWTESEWVSVCVCVCGTRAHVCIYAHIHCLICTYINVQYGFIIFN
jgi:hypothetical protein